MSTSTTTRDRPALHPMRQQLDELDALLQRMLELPVNNLDEISSPPEPADPVSADPDAGPPRMRLVPLPAPEEGPAAPAALELPEERQEILTPPTLQTPISLAPRLIRVEQADAIVPAQQASPAAPPPEAETETAGESETQAAFEVPAEPVAESPPEMAGSEPTEEAATAESGGEVWVPLRSSWQPSANTWPPLAETWQQAKSGRLPPANPESAQASVPEPAPTEEPHPESVEPALAPRREPEPPVPGTVSRAISENQAATGPMSSRVETPPRPTLWTAPDDSLSSRPAQTTSRPAGEMPAPVLSLSAGDVDPPPVEEHHILWGLLPLVWFNQGFDACLQPLGGTGRWLSGRTGRAVLGTIGLLSLAAAVALAIGERIGWTW
jgi:hypothetical protein